MRDTSTHRLLGHVFKESGKVLHRGNLNTVALCGPYNEECARLKGKLLRERTELSFRKVRLRRRPVIIDLPQRLGGKRGKREPIVEFVFFEVGEGDE